MLPKKSSKIQLTRSLGHLLSSLALVVLFMSSAQAQNRPLRLKVAFFQPAGNPTVELSKEALEEIVKATEGRVRFDLFPSSTLLPTAEMISGVNDGVAFAAVAYIPYMAKTIPLFDLETLPVWTNGCEGMRDAFAGGLGTLYDEAFKRQGLTNTKLAGLAQCLPRVLATKKEVRIPSDVKGESIRSVGAEANIFRIAGANPVNMTMDQTYEATSRGIIFGLTNMLTSFYERRHLEILKNVTNLRLTYTTLGVVYNPTALQRLGERDQAVVSEGLKKLAEHVYNGSTRYNLEVVDKAKSEFGTVFHDLSDAEHIQWQLAGKRAASDFERQGDNDPLIKAGMQIVRKFNP